ncbi:hypothetical protein A1E_03580 [Rickettsia canadensis str. McKiel]|uniref:Uncharacterized protein n=1 Tax=Rickettsia canadensis (strain McKiel) TaxID=293613 RepID=A8EZ66_RICCK|nr:hypothetical protein A1E_03580 [Rickettsia canadensis str. McKiel]
MHSRWDKHREELAKALKGTKKKIESISRGV